MNFDDELMMMNKWKKKYNWLARGVLDHDCIMLQSSVAASFLFL